MTVLHNIRQLACCPANQTQHDIGLIENAAVVYQQAHIVWCGQQCDLPEIYRTEPRLNVGGGLVIPGLVDCHTHLCFGGWRGDEFEMRIQGRSYQEIAAAGGGIRSTVAATRAAHSEYLLSKARQALDGMLKLGVTTVECKSGYGLSTEHELKQLRVYQTLDQCHAIDLVATFLGAHIIPPEYAECRDDYIALICKEMLPLVWRERLAEFCDIYIDTGAYTVEEGQQILTAAGELGFKLKAHAEQLSATGAARLAAKMGAISVEHLEYLPETDREALREAGTVAVSLPLASLYLREKYIQARALINHGIPVAVATDFNPGSAPSWHLPLALTLACLNQGMTPAEALKGATTHAARAIGRHRQIGSIAPGMQADLTIIDAPSVNHWLYHMTPNACQAVIKKGQVVHSILESFI